MIVECCMLLHGSSGVACNIFLDLLISSTAGLHGNCLVFSYSSLIENVFLILPRQMKNVNSQWGAFFAHNNEEGKLVYFTTQKE